MSVCFELTVISALFVRFWLCVFKVSQWYELVVFTASMEIYGSAVADKLDNNRNILKRRYYRQVAPGLTLHRRVDAASTDFIFKTLSPLCVFFFQHCTLDLGSYIKDLSVVHDDLSSIVILDNSPGAYRSHPGKTQQLFLVHMQAEE